MKISEAISKEETDRIFQEHGLPEWGIVDTTNHGRLLVKLIERVLGKDDNITQIQPAEWDHLWDELVKVKKIWKKFHMELD